MTSEKYETKDLESTSSIHDVRANVENKNIFQDKNNQSSQR